MVHVLLLLGCAVVIYLACEWFVNAVEWFGVEFKVGAVAVGNILAAAGTALPGQLLHLCVRQPDGTLRYIDVWDSEEACARAFEERIHPAVDAAFGGNRPTTEPTVQRLDVLHAGGAMLEPTWS